MTFEKDLIASIKLAAEALSVYCEYVSQRGGKNSGTSRGCPDLFCYVGGQCIPIEAKRAKNPDGTPAGKLSLAQTVAIEKRREQGVRTHVVTTVEEFAQVVNAARRNPVRRQVQGVE